MAAPQNARHRGPRPLARALPALLVLFVLLPVAEAAAESKPVVEGQARDADTGEPLVGAWIFEAVPARRAAADVPRVARARWTRTDERGRFSFPPDQRLRWPWGPAPRYHLYHPSYGLVRGREAADGRVALAASLRDAHLRQEDARRFCAPALADREDEMTRRLRELVCPPAQPDLHADGSPRATGAIDARGRREGDWTFHREDGSVIAEGRYRAGAAVGTWRFRPPTRTKSD